MLESILNSSCFAGGMAGGPGHWSSGGHMMNFGFGGFSMMFMWLVFLILIGVAVYVAVRLASSGTVGQPTESETPLDVLEKRYARGEIDEEEFEKRKEKLTS